MMEMEEEEEEKERGASPAIPAWGTYLGKWVRISVRFSGTSLSFSTRNFSSSCRRVTVKMDLRRLRPKTWVVS